MNTDVIFDPAKFIYYDEIITKIIIRQNKEPIDNISQHNKIDLNNINSTVYRIMIGFFISGTKKYDNFISVVEFIGKLYLDSVRGKIKNAKDNLVYIVRTALSGIFSYKNMIEKHQIKDRRFDHMFSSLINVYKKLFFNSTSKIIINMVYKLKTPEYLQDNEGNRTYIIYMDFFKELKNFINEFEIFVEYKGFSSIISEFIRKHIYTFICHLTYILSDNLYDVSIETYYLLLDGVFYLIRETDKLLTYLPIKFGHHCIIPKHLLNFKKTFLNLGDVLYNYIVVDIDTEIDKIEQLDVESFDFGIFLNTKLGLVHERLKRLHNYYSMKFFRHIMFKLVTKLIQSFKVKEKIWIQENFKEKVNEFSDYFLITMKSYNFDNFAKFFEYYRKFVFTKSLENAELFLSMMGNILGQRLDIETVNQIIKTRVHDTFGLQSLSLKKSYASIIEQQAQGDENIQNKQKHRKRVSHLFSVFLVSVRFIGKHRLWLKKHRNHVSSKLTNKEHDSPKINGVNYTINHKGSQSFKMLFIRNPEYHTWDDNSVIDDLKAEFVKSAVFKYSLHFSRDSVYLLDEKSKVIKSFFLSKFDELHQTNINRKPCLIVSYGRCDKLVLSSSKQQKIDVAHKVFSEVLARTKELVFNNRRYYNKY